MPWLLQDALTKYNTQFLYQGSQKFFILSFGKVILVLFIHRLPWLNKGTITNIKLLCPKTSISTRTLYFTKQRVYTTNFVFNFQDSYNIYRDIYHLICIIKNINIVIYNLKFNLYIKFNTVLITLSIKWFKLNKTIVYIFSLLFLKMDSYQ